jgi:hypothetical protein
VKNALLLPVCGQSAAASDRQNNSEPRWFGSAPRSVYFAPQPPSGDPGLEIATQAGGSAGPLLADPPLFLPGAITPWRLEIAENLRDMSAVGERLRSPRPVSSSTRRN